VPFRSKKSNRKKVKLYLTRHWLELANQWLEVTRQFLWLDSSKSWLDFDSTRKNFRLLWLEGLVALTRIWLDKNDSDTSLHIVYYPCAAYQRWARIRTESDWTGLKPILAGSALDRSAIFFKLADQDWITLRKFLWF